MVEEKKYPDVFAYNAVVSVNIVSSDGSRGFDREFKVTYISGNEEADVNKIVRKVLKKVIAAPTEVTTR